MKSLPKKILIFLTFFIMLIRTPSVIAQETYHEQADSSWTCPVTQLNVGITHLAPHEPNDFARPLVVLLALLVGSISNFLFSPKALRGFGFLVLATGAILRLIFRPTFLAIDGDDLALAGWVLKVPTSYLSSNSSSFSPTIVGLYRAFVALGGENVLSMFLPAAFFATLMPLLVMQFAYLWGREERVARVAALLATFYPPLVAFGASSCQELPASVLFAQGLVVGLWGLRQRISVAAVSTLVAGGLCGLAISLKEEFPVLLVPLFLLGLGHPERSRRLIYWTLLVSAIAIFFNVPIRLYLFFERVIGEGARLELKNLTSYLLYGVLLINPPSAPLIWLFFKDLIKPIRQHHRPLHGWVLTFLLMFMSAVIPFGWNHNRYSLNWMIPICVVLAPIIIDLWNAALQRMVLPIAILGIAALAQLAMFGWWFHQRSEPRQRDLETISDHAFSPNTLVVFADHGQDTSPALALALIGGFDAVGIPKFWPESCPQAKYTEMSRLRTYYRSMCQSSRCWESAFYHLFTFEEDRVRLASMELLPYYEKRRLMLERCVENVAKRENIDRCITAIAEMKTTLSQYHQIVLFVDSESLSSEDDRNHLEMLDIAIKELKLQLHDSTPGFLEIESIPDPLKRPGAPPIWTKRN